MKDCVDGLFRINDSLFPMSVFAADGAGINFRAASSSMGDSTRGCVEIGVEVLRKPFTFAADPGRDMPPTPLLANADEGTVGLVVVIAEGGRLKKVGASATEYLDMFEASTLR